MLKLQFVKQPTGGWLFQIGARWFIAQRNEAGFAHRDWDLLRLEGGGYRHVEDQLSSRAECVEVAERWVS